MKPQPMLNLPDLSDIGNLRRRSSYHRIRNLLNCASMRSPLASGVEQLFATRSLHPANGFRRCRLLAHLHHRSQQPVAFQLSSICNRPLFDQNSRLRLASEQSCDCPSPTQLRVPIDVSSIHLLAKLSALKLRLERFRTSHARVQVNLLLWRTGASEIKTIFVNILFKTCPCCGVGWIRKQCAVRAQLLVQKFSLKTPAMHES